MSTKRQNGTENLRFCFAIDDLTTSNSISVKAISALANRRRSVIFLTIRLLCASK
jgi:hypothetical protein